MTNKELRDKLKEFPDDMKVGVTADSNAFIDEIDPKITKLYDSDTLEEVEDFITLGDLT
ncbi:MAG: hypothetical protein ACRCR5_08105 [Lactococcus garvieae]